MVRGHASFEPLEPFAIPENAEVLVAERLHPPLCDLANGGTLVGVTEA